MQWLSINDAMKTLNCSRRTIWRRIKDGSLQSKEEGGKRFVMIEGGENKEPGTEPSAPGEIKKPKILGKGTLTLDLMETLFELKKRIAERTKLARDVERISCSFPDYAEQYGQNVRRWVHIYRLVKETYAKAVEGLLIERNELQRIFHGFLEARHEAGELESERISELNEAIEEIGDPERTEIIQQVEEEKEMMERDLDLFDQAISILKKIIVSIQGVEE